MQSDKTSWREWGLFLFKNYKEVPREVGRISQWNRTPSRQIICWKDYLVFLFCDLLEAFGTVIPFLLKFSLPMTLKFFLLYLLLFSFSIAGVSSSAPLMTQGVPSWMSSHSIHSALQGAPSPRAWTTCYMSSPDLCSPDFSQRLGPICPQPCPFFHFRVFAHTTLLGMFLPSSSSAHLFAHLPLQVLCYSNSRPQLDALAPNSSHTSLMVCCFAFFSQVLVNNLRSETVSVWHLCPALTWAEAWENQSDGT